MSSNCYFAVSRIFVSNLMKNRHLSTGTECAILVIPNTSRALPRWDKMEDMSGPIPCLGLPIRADPAFEADQCTVEFHYSMPP